MMADHFATIITAARKAQAQFSVIHGSQTDNEEIIRELASDLMKAIAGLVYDAGGDADYAESWVDGLPNDIDLSFKSAAETVVPLVRYGLVRGATL